MGYANPSTGCSPRACDVRAQISECLHVHSSTCVQKRVCACTCIPARAYKNACGRARWRGSPKANGYWATAVRACGPVTACTCTCADGSNIMRACSHIETVHRRVQIDSERTRANTLRARADATGKNVYRRVSMQWGHVYAYEPVRVCWHAWARTRTYANVRAWPKRHSGAFTCIYEIHKCACMYCAHVRTCSCPRLRIRARNSNSSSNASDDSGRSTPKAIAVAVEGATAVVAAAMVVLMVWQQCHWS